MAGLVIHEAQTIPDPARCSSSTATASRCCAASATRSPRSRSPRRSSRAADEARSRVSTGRFVRLEPFAPALEAEVRRRSTSTRRPGANLSSPGRPALPRLVGGAMAERPRGRIPFAVRRHDAARWSGPRASTRSRAHRDARSARPSSARTARGGPVNPECKRLMLGHAFAAGALRVELVVDARNQEPAAIRSWGPAGRRAAPAQDHLDRLRARHPCSSRSPTRSGRRCAPAWRRGWRRSKPPRAKTRSSPGAPGMYAHAALFLRRAPRFRATGLTSPPP